MALETYRQKRNFRRTSEPRGRKAPAQRSKGNSFVVQKHDARNLHYDFRLELGGVMLSWAVPKGPSLDPKVKRLAMQTEDHPIEYSDFEGIIPEGEYGGGTVLVWDRGSWKPEGDAEDMYRRGRLSFELQGEKLHGGFHLVRTASAGRSRGKSAGKAGERSWLLFKSNDAEARPGSDAQLLEAEPLSVASGRDLADVAASPDHVWTSKRKAGAAKSTQAELAKASPRAAARPSPAQHGAKRAKLPPFVEPQLATLTAEAPEGQDWLHEIKLDGYRIQARIEKGRVQLLTRRGHDWSARLPSIASALGTLKVESALLDGELVVLRDDGVSDFQLLQNSLEAGRDGSCVYFAFDALFLDGQDLRQLPLSERKDLLRPVIGKRSPRVRLSDHVQGTGPEFFQQACQRHLEGIVCKRADAPYSSGRGRSWLKVKCLSVQEFVVGGFTEPAGSRSHLGALLVGVREGKELRYAGKVGTGFTQTSLAQLAKRLKLLERSEPAFDNPPRGSERRGVHWVEPQLVAQISFVERTRDGLIRHASFHGLRDDKSSDEVKLEQPEPNAKVKVKVKAKTKAKTTTKTKTTMAPAKIELDLSRIEITHPDRILYPDQGLTKRDLMLHYARVARWMLPHVTERPLMLVRCPEGEGGQCFHQKHPSRGMPKAVQQVTVPQKKGPEANLMIRDVEGLLGLVQMGALELHTWGCRADSLECPDQLVFDLDPDEGLAWQRVVDAAHALRERLQAVGLTAFLKWTGGKGLHVVTPIEAKTPWDEAKAFSKGIADAFVKEEPARYIATMTKQKRKGKIFIDYLRNGPGATSVCVYSTRARPGAPVALPLAWEALERELKPGAFNVKNLEQHLAQRERDPWADFAAARAPLRPPASHPRASG